MNFVLVHNKAICPLKFKFEKNLDYLKMLVNSFSEQTLVEEKDKDLFIVWWRKNVNHIIE